MIGWENYQTEFKFQHVQNCHTNVQDSEPLSVFNAKDKKSWIFKVPLKAFKVRWNLVFTQNQLIPVEILISEKKLIWFYEVNNPYA